MQADSEVELHRSVLTMALTPGMSLNAIYELFPIYVCQEDVGVRFYVFPSLRVTSDEKEN